MKVKKKNLARWRYALWPTDNSDLAAVLVFGMVFFVALLSISGDNWLIVLVPLLFLAAGYAALVFGALNYYDSVGEKAIREAASRWVRAGVDEADVRRRREMFDQLGASGALAAAGVHIPEPSINVDGRPMVGNGLDDRGKPYGVTDNSYYDNGNDMALTPMAEYQSPIGMDHHDFGSGGTSWDHNH